MPAEDVRHPEKQPKSSKGDEKKYKKQRKKQKREGRSTVPGRESLLETNFQTPVKLLTAESMLSLGSTEGNITGWKNK